MRYFAEVDTAALIVKSVFPWEVEGVTPELEARLIQPVDITGLDPMPAVGWLYDAETGIFTEAV